jgi:protein-S-isoprenylcysteine O-methyltransferase Ste14/GNAT superfamily N-acetyltransferase
MGLSFTVLRALAYGTGFVALWGWLALAVLPLDRTLGVALPGWTRVLGVGLLALGGALALNCVLVFAVRGAGTPAPFDPPRRFVAAGPYRSVRNPMYLAGFTAFLGFGLYHHSPAILALGGVMLGLAHLFVVLYEEPNLERRFGESYREYKRTVRRWLPHRPMDAGSPARAVTVRAATVGDVGVLARHRAEMFRDMGTLAPEAYDTLVQASRRYFETAIPAGTYVGWLAAPAERPDEIVAGAGVQVRELLPRPDASRRRLMGGPEGYVLNVFTERAWRRRGIAERLMREVLAWARAHGIEHLTLHASDAGWALYERLGFVRTNEMRYNRGRGERAE